MDNFCDVNSLRISLKSNMCFQILKFRIVSGYPVMKDRHEKYEFGNETECFVKTFWFG